MRRKRTPNRRFSFFWAPLDDLPFAGCHPVFPRALRYLTFTLTAQVFVLPQDQCTNIAFEAEKMMFANGYPHRQLLAVLSQSWPRSVMIESDGNDWSGRMQMGGKSVQLSRQVTADTTERPL